MYDFFNKKKKRFSKYAILLLLEFKIENVFIKIKKIFLNIFLFLKIYTCNHVSYYPIGRKTNLVAFSQVY